MVKESRPMALFTATDTQLRAMNTVASGIRIEDVEAYLQELEHYEAFGPFSLAPWEYTKGSDNVRAMKEVAQSFLAYRRVLAKYAPK